MIDVRLLRTDLDGVRAATARRGDPALLDQVDAAVGARRPAARDHGRGATRLRAKVNELSRQVGQLRRTGDVAAAEQRQAESRQLGDDEKALADEHDEVAEALRDILLVLPNLVHPDAPDGASDADNPVVRGPFNLPERVRRAPAGAALGDRRRARASSTTSGRSRSAGRCSR